MLQTSTLELALRDTQTELYALPDKAEDSENFTVDDGFNIRRLSVAEAFPTGSLKYMVSTFDAYDRLIRDTDFGPGRKVVTFANVLSHNVFPLADIVSFMLTTGQYELGRPVEIEFAGNINPNASGSDEKGKLYWLQIRPIVDRKEMLDDSIMHVEDCGLILRSDTALGHGLMDNVRTVVYVKPSTFDRMRNPEVALEVEKLNARLTEENEPYVLVGPGRWGSSDFSLGVPVKWPQIAGARLIVETAMPGYFAGHAFLPEPHFVRRRLLHG